MMEVKRGERGLFKDRSQGSRASVAHGVEICSEDAKYQVRSCCVPIYSKMPWEVGSKTACGANIQSCKSLLSNVAGEI
jgi:hypothetical protein